MITLWLFGLVSPESFAVFLFASVGLGILLSVNAMFLEELSFHLYPRPRQQLKLFVAAVLENFGYRQLNSLWRLMGLLRWVTGLKGKQHWGDIRQNASWQYSDAEVDPAPETRHLPSRDPMPSNAS